MSLLDTVDIISQFILLPSTQLIISPHPIHLWRNSLSCMPEKAQLLVFNAFFVEILTPVAIANVITPTDVETDPMIGESAGMQVWPIGVQVSTEKDPIIGTSAVPSRQLQPVLTEQVDCLATKGGS